jgi:Leucine-rich repeat (LRR) protein
LYLSRTGIIYLQDRTGFFDKSIDLGRLEVLDLDHCEKLQLIDIKALQLQELNANDCRLREDNIKLDAPRLRELNLSGNSIEKLEVQYPELQELNLVMPTIFF